MIRISGGGQGSPAPLLRRIGKTEFEIGGHQALGHFQAARGEGGVIFRQFHHCGDVHEIRIADIKGTQARGDFDVEPLCGQEEIIVGPVNVGPKIHAHESALRRQS